MTSKYRSLSGVVLMLLVIPIFAGLLACMPVPIGDPERSRMDPDLTGIWVSAVKDDASELIFYVVEPYDKRTWLIMGAEIESSDDVDLDDYDFSTYAGYEKLAADNKKAPGNVYSNALILYKAWLVKLGGERFWTWEHKGKVDALNEDPEFWMVYRVRKESENTLILRMIDPDTDPFEDIEETRRAFERVIKKNANNPAIYYDGDDGPAKLMRAEGDVLTFLENIAVDLLEGN